MTIPISLACTVAGWKRALQQPRLVLLLAAIQLAAVLPFAVGIAGWAHQSFALSPELDHWGTAPSISGWAALRRGPAAVLGNLDSLLEFASPEGVRSASSFFRLGGLGAVAFLSLLFSLAAGPFVAAAIVSRGPDAANVHPEAPERDLLRVVREIAPFFALLLLPVLVFDLASYWLLVVMAGRAMAGLLPEGGTERSWLVLVAGRYLVWGVAVFLAHRVLDHARIHAFLTERRQLLPALAAGFRVVRTNATGASLTAILPLLPLAALAALWSFGRDLIGGGWSGLLVVLAGHGTILLARQAQKCAVLLAQMELQVRTGIREDASVRTPRPADDDQYGPDRIPGARPSVAYPHRDNPASYSSTSIAPSGGGRHFGARGDRMAPGIALQSPSPVLPFEPVVLRAVDDGLDAAAARDDSTAWPARIETIDEENRRVAEAEVAAEAVSDAGEFVLPVEPTVLRPAGDGDEVTGAGDDSTAWPARIETIEEENRRAAEDEQRLPDLPPPEGHLPADALVIRGSRRGEPPGPVSLPTAWDPLLHDSLPPSDGLAGPVPEKLIPKGARGK